MGGFTRRKKECSKTFDFATRKNFNEEITPNLAWHESVMPCEILMFCEKY